MSTRHRARGANHPRVGKMIGDRSVFAGAGERPRRAAVAAGRGGRIRDEGDETTKQRNHELNVWHCRDVTGMKL